MADDKKLTTKSTTPVQIPAIPVKPKPPKTMEVTRSEEVRDKEKRG